VNLDRILTVLTRIPGARSLWRRFPIGSVERRVQFGVWSRPNYAYGVYWAAKLARQLGLPGISVIELGVAGGRGLLALEDIAQQVSRQLAIRIAVAGFDSGVGMPEPLDYRDLPHAWNKGFYRMDPDKLRARLSRAELFLGDVGETISSWLAGDDVPPIGFVAFDLDYYSSTKRAFRLFESSHSRRLPRMYCYFDDLMWPEHACHNEYTGELCAIREFNIEHGDKKLCPLNMLRHMRIHPQPWNDQMYVLHDFGHPLYCKNVTILEQHEQLSL
jgi:hypothetical protein